MTLFIILGIVLVVGIVGFFLFVNKNIEDVNTPEKLGPKGFIDGCVQDSIKDSLEKIFMTGGILNPVNTMKYNGTNYTYLCHSGEINEPCTNVYPGLESRIESTVISETTESVKNCFGTLKEDFENRGYTVEQDGTAGYSIDIITDYILIDLEWPLVMTSNGATQSFENFNSRISSPTKDILRTIVNIINSEAENCDFDSTLFMLLNPDKKITTKVYNENKIYWVEDRKTGVEVSFAVRGCVS